MFLDLPDEMLALVVLTCCDFKASWTRKATHSILTLEGPSCHILCTNKRLRDCGKKDPAWGEKLAEKRTAFLHGLFWLRVRFFSRAWGSLLRAANLGLSANAMQEHVFQKDGQSLKITAEFIRRKRNKCWIELELHMRDSDSTGLTAVKGSMDIDLPKAYATRPEKRRKNQQEEMRDWAYDRSAELDHEFAELHKHFVHAKRPIFAYW